MSRPTDRIAWLHRLGLISAVACVMVSVLCFALRALAGEWGWATYFFAAGVWNLYLARWNAKWLWVMAS